MTNNIQLDGNELFKRQIDKREFNAPYIICDGLKSPDNLGALLRVADAAGSKKIILLDSQMNLNNKRISKLARNANKFIELDEMSLSEFKVYRARFKHLFALEITSSSSDVFDCDISPCDAILIGHESIGIREEVLALCDNTLHLPMYGFNGSMNISHALIVFLYEWRRQNNL
ncbi:MAG: TrmH family RNA methyltransferase [Gammaproteobacteria bacterium]|nr:TrmH family RNA methyltransferase [Gammaproteobacteria bacterium]